MLHFFNYVKNIDAKMKNIKIIDVLNYSKNMSKKCLKPTVSDN